MKISHESKIKDLILFSLGESRTLAVNDDSINEKQQGTYGLSTDHRII